MMHESKRMNGNEKRSKGERVGGPYTGLGIKSWGKVLSFLLPCNYLLEFGRWASWEWHPVRCISGGFLQIIHTRKFSK